MLGRSRLPFGGKRRKSMKGLSFEEIQLVDGAGFMAAVGEGAGAGATVGGMAGAVEGGIGAIPGAAIGAVIGAVGGAICYFL